MAGRTHKGRTRDGSLRRGRRQVPRKRGQWEGDTWYQKPWEGRGAVMKGREKEDAAAESLKKSCQVGGGKLGTGKGCMRGAVSEE